MVGKHIFVRCRNEQGNAGTWTAAVTENIVDKDIIRNHIEPRCNVDETFAQETLMAFPANNILRMYYANPSTLIVSRSFWVTDRITETQGRKGAYSISYILTDEDVARFCNDYSGAFDVDCFETYDNLIARISANDNNKITVDDGIDLFSHKSVPTDASVLSRCNFTKDTFVAFMEALYDAMENRKQVAVVLPKAMRDAWVENGDSTAEQLGHFMLSLLPDFARINCGMVSHWSCQINDKMVSDMPLLFVHSRNDEDYSYLKREGAHIIDLDTGAFTSQTPKNATEYFSFIWDNVSDMEKIEEFWAYGKSNYRKLLRGRPVSASAMECIYLIRCITESGYSDLEKSHTALKLAAREFAGAGARVPAAENFLTEVISKLKLDKNPVDDGTEAALRHLLVSDGEKTKHQLQEYQILLAAVEAGTAKPETVSALCAELLKEAREADTYFLSYITDKASLPAKKITPQLTQLISELFLTAYQHQSSAAITNIIQTIFGIIEDWTNRILASSNAWQTLVMPFAEAYIAYIKAEEHNAAGLHAAYAFLFQLRTKADAELREKCEKILLKEEVRICRSGNSAVLNDGSTRFSVFASAFLLHFPQMSKESMDVFTSGYDRLFRILFNPEASSAESALTTYTEVTKEVLSTHAEAAEKIAQRIYSCQERALQDKPPIWIADVTEKMILRAENVHLQLFETYVPSEERLSILTDNLDAKNQEIYVLFVDYLQRASFNGRQYIYSVLSRQNMLTSLFVHVLFNCEPNNIFDEIEGLLGLSHDEAIRRIFSLNLFDNSEDAARWFASWFRQKTERAFFDAFPNADSVSEQQHALAKSEYKLLKDVKMFSNDLYSIALDVFAGILCKLYNRIERNQIIALPDSLIRDIVWLQSNIITKESLTHKQIFTLAYAVDDIVLNKGSYELRELCEKYGENADMKLILQKRISMHLHANRCTSPLACNIYRVMIAPSAGGRFQMPVLLNSLNYDSLSPAERSVLLAKILLQLHEDNAAIEGEVGQAVLDLLDGIALEDNQVLLNGEFAAYWPRIRSFDCFRGTPFLRTMQKPQRGRSTMNASKEFGPYIVALAMAILALISMVLPPIKFLVSVWGIVIYALVSLVLIAFTGLLILDLCSSKKRR